MSDQWQHWTVWYSVTVSGSEAHSRQHGGFIQETEPGGNPG
jgi:hypothetical protein